MSSQLSRRELLRLGGIGIVSSALLAACSKSESTSDNAIASIGTTPQTTALPKAEVSDVVLLRTAASLEFSAIDTYTTLLDGGNFSGDFASAEAVARRFRDDHVANAEAINLLILDHGGERYECANTRFNSLVVNPTIELIASPENPDVALDTVTLAHAIETVSAQMYQGFVGQFSEPKLRGETIHIGQTSARRVVILAQLLNPGLGGVERSADPATGISKAAAVPSAFGGLAIIRVPFGPPNEDGAKTSITMETPSLNALIYEFVSC